MAKVKITETYVSDPEGEIIVRRIDPCAVNGLMIGRPVPMKMVSREEFRRLYPCPPASR